MITTGSIMTSCKYMLPCGYCELKKEMCSLNEPFTVTQTWPIIPTTVPSEITTSTLNDAMKTLSKGAKNE